MSRLLKFRCFYRGVMYPVKEMQFEDDDSFSVSIIEMDLDGLGTRDVSPDSEHIEGIMQFTGLHDKNGKEIFEGDVVKCAIGVGKVIFHAGSFMLEWLDDKEASMELLGEKNIARGVFRVRDDFAITVGVLIWFNS